jgi:hypothetical protein
MSLNVRHKHSSVQDQAPQPSDLVNGEIALNINANSTALYTKNSAGAVVKLAPTDAPVDSVFGRTGAVVAANGDYDLGELGDVDLSTTAPTNGQFLSYDGANWVPGDVVSSVDLGYTSSATDGTVTNSAGLDATIPLVTAADAGLLSPGDKTKLDGIQAGAEVNAVDSVFGRTGAVVATDGDYDLGELGDVDLTTTPPSSGQVLSYDGANWVPQTTASAPVDSVFGRTGAVVATEGDYDLDQLGDVDLTSSAPTSGQFLKYDGANWVPGSVVSSVDLGYTAAASSGTVTNTAGTDATIPAFTSTNAGLVGGSGGGTANYLRADGTWAAPPGDATDLGYTASATDGTVTSSTGTDATVPLVTGTNAGLIAPGDKTKLDGIQAGAEVNAVDSVFGRTGAVVATEGDYSLDQLGDVDLTTTPPTTGQILTYDGAGWVADDVSVPDPLTVNNLTVNTLLTAEHIHGNLAGSVYIHVKNTDTVQLDAGTPFYITGTVGASDRVEVQAADSADPAKGPAVGVLETTLAVNGEGNGTIIGEIFNYDTATPGWSTNDELYVANGGGLTNVKPTSGYRQIVAYVGRIQASTGTLVLTGTSVDPVAGSDGQIQFNDDGGFGADSGLTFNKTTNELTVGVSNADPGTATVKGDLNLDSGGSFSTTIQSVTPTANRTISFPDQTGTVGLVAGATGNIQYNNAGALTGSADLNVELNWNSSTTVYTGLKLNATDTLSAPGSKLVDLQINGTTIGQVDSTGVRFTRIGSTSGLGDFYITRTLNECQLTINANNINNGVVAATTGFYVGAASGYYWSSGAIPSSAPVDTALVRDSANVIAVTNGFTGTGYLKQTPVLVGDLPAAATVGAGTRGFVSDATATTFASVVTGSGTASTAGTVPVYSDGTDWRIG